MKNRLFLVALCVIILWGAYKLFVVPQPWFKLGQTGERIGGKTNTTTKVKIYLVALGDGTVSGPTTDQIGCGDTVVGVDREVPYTPAPLRAALTELLSLHDRNYGESGLYNSLYRSHLSIDSLAIDKGIATIKLVGTHQLGGVCDNPRFEAQLIRTALQFPSVTKAEYFINGVALKNVLSLK